jgi:hypothetical protein
MKRYNMKKIISLIFFVTVLMAGSLSYCSDTQPAFVLPDGYLLMEILNPTSDSAQKSVITSSPQLFKELEIRLGKISGPVHLKARDKDASVALMFASLHTDKIKEVTLIDPIVVEPSYNPLHYFRNNFPLSNIHFPDNLTVTIENNKSENDSQTFLDFLKPQNKILISKTKKENLILEPNPSRLESVLQQERNIK